MNVERLHAVATAIVQDLVAMQTIETLDKIVADLQAHANDVEGRAAVSEKIEGQWANLTRRLSSSKTNGFPPSWIAVLKELGAEDLLSRNLLDRLEEINQRDHVTSSITLSELSRMRQRLSALRKNFSQISQSFNSVGLSAEKILPGTCALGIVIPRREVSDALQPLSKELRVVSRIIDVFGEITTGSVQESKISAISSSDFSFLISIDPATAACLVVVVDRMLTIYKNVLDIRVSHKQLSKQGLPKEVLEGVDGHANRQLAEGITDLVNLIRKDHWRTTGRKEPMSCRPCSSMP